MGVAAAEEHTRGASPFTAFTISARLAGDENTWRELRGGENRLMGQLRVRNKSRLPNSTLQCLAGDPLQLNCWASDIATSPAVNEEPSVSIRERVDAGPRNVLRLLRRSALKTAARLLP